MSDCEKCWETPCRCGHDYKRWSIDDLRELLSAVKKVLKSKVARAKKQQKRKKP